MIGSYISNAQRTSSDVEYPFAAACCALVAGFATRSVVAKASNWARVSQVFATCARVVGCLFRLTWTRWLRRLDTPATTTEIFGGLQTFSKGC